jgi:hypothetical protein
VVRDSSNFILRILALVRWVPRAAVQAVFDAGRAWAIAPTVYRMTVYAQNASGGWCLRYRRPFRRQEVLKVKISAARRIFIETIKLGIARSVVIPRYPEEGLLANLLHVLEVVHRVRLDASVHVDWVLKGTEIGFRYGEPGDDIWARLFQTLGPCPPAITHRAVSRVDLAFWGTGRDHLIGRRLQKHRRVYHSTILKWLEITNKQVLAQVREIFAQFLDGRFCIGIHRRVGNALVAGLQSDGKVPSLETLIKAVEAILSILTKEGVADHAIFLATDDAEAVDGFKRAFGCRLIVRDNVQRTTSDAAEVHFRDWDRLSITDAEDVLVDTLLLSKCDVLVHASSSVSTVASIMNPALTLVRV